MRGVLVHGICGFLAGTHSRCILHSSQLPVCLQKFVLCLSSSTTQALLGIGLHVGLVIMGELEMESLMMTMPVLPTLTYNEAVQLSYLLLHQVCPPSELHCVLKIVCFSPSSAMTESEGDSSSAWRKNCIVQNFCQAVNKHNVSRNMPIGRQCVAVVLCVTGTCLQNLCCFR